LKIIASQSLVKHFFSPYKQFYKASIKQRYKAPNPKFSGEGRSASDNPSPLQRLFGLYFILMAEKCKKVNPKLETREKRKFSIATVNLSLLII
jgi:hypothetical protein